MVSYSEDFRFLRNSMLCKELVVFVGAGVSMGSGLPSWNKLVEEIQNRLGISDLSFNDNTIVPQLFYNSRGKKEYNDLIHSLLCIPNSLPNESHECIVKINPRYIITTNYDELIEKAFIENGIFLDVVEKDSDLPYAHTEHMLIKMHGSFKTDNFVLKEDDYLNYSNNFTLISSYIKALLARYTVLFVGYSFNDPNTKQLFSWVRSIVKEDQQRAYLINVDDDYDSQTYDYYKNIGINVIYAKSFLDSKYEPDNKTKDTVMILNNIIEPQHEIIAELNSIFKGYEAFYYISNDYIQNAFNSFFTCSLNDCCLTFYCNNESEFSDANLYFDESNADTNKLLKSKYPYILKAILKSSINEIRFIKTYCSFDENKELHYSISGHVAQDDISQFEEFNYALVKNATNPLEEETEKNYLKKAYCLYFLHNYTSCYELLRTTAKHYLSTNQLERYLIAENNRINVGKLLFDNPFIRISPLQRRKIKQEINNSEKYGLYANSYSFVKNNNPVSELLDFKYIYKILYRIIDNGWKVDEEARTKYFVSTGKHAYEKIENTAIDLYKYMQYNYLLLNVYSETKRIYTAFVDSILLSLSTKEESSDDGLFGKSNNIVLNELSRFVILVILRFLSYKELKSLTSKYRIDRIDLEKEAVNYLYRTISNLNESYNNDLIPYDDLSVFNILFHIFKKIDLSQDLFSMIFTTTTILLEKYNDSLIEYAEINSFIAIQFKERNHSFTPDQLEQLILKMCNVASRNNEANHNPNYIRILKNLIHILHEIDPDRTISISIKEKEIFLVALPSDILVFLYSISEETIRKAIHKRIVSTLAQTEDVNTYYLALLYDIIKPQKKYENLLLESANNKTPNNNNIIFSANLFLQNKIINKEHFMDLIKSDKSLHLVIDPESFNYSEFDSSLLTLLTDKSLKILSSNKKAYGFIHEELKKCFFNNRNEKLIEIYFKYFS